ALRQPEDRIARTTACRRRAEGDNRDPWPRRHTACPHQAGAEADAAKGVSLEAPLPSRMTSACRRGLGLGRLQRRRAERRRRQPDPRPPPPPLQTVTTDEQPTPARRRCPNCAEVTHRFA